MERIDGATQLPLVLVYHGPYLTHSPFWEWKALRHLLSLGFIWVFPKMGGAPKWMVFFRENPYWKNDDLGVPLFLETPISIIHLQNLPGGRFTPQSPWLWGLCGAEFLLFMTWTPHEPRGKALVKGISGWKLLNFEGPTELYPQWKLRFACIFVWWFSSNKFVLKKTLHNKFGGWNFMVDFGWKKKHTSPFGNVRVACSQNSGCFEIPLILNWLFQSELL